uniref:Uncharacterized protein n=1 Tax=Romanomermis culicivorax TaxID=13658 RepID=A0A915KZU3_ROMCU
MQYHIVTFLVVQIETRGVITYGIVRLAGAEFPGLDDWEQNIVNISVLGRSKLCMQGKCTSPYGYTRAERQQTYDVALDRSSLNMCKKLAEQADTLLVYHHVFVKQILA